jgi:hypothetical protein
MSMRGFAKHDSGQHTYTFVCTELESRVVIRESKVEIEGLVIIRNAASGITLDEDKGRASCLDSGSGT